ncbi:MAG: hypothetical protein K0Q91_153 [Fibrobacteria bacterium]|jgi:hypothetical protein|nr:hypothetical protein [Fibrobacteria bacterium]
MIRTITDTKDIPVRIAQVLDMDHPRWLEKVLLLVGFYTSPKRMVRTLQVKGKRKARVRAMKQTSVQKKAAASVRKEGKGARSLMPSIA